MSEKNDNQKNVERLIKVCSVTFPLRSIIGWYLAIAAVHLVSKYLAFSRLNLNDVFIIIILSVIYYFYAHYQYYRLDIYFDRIRITYPISFFLKQKEYLFSDINLVFFQFNYAHKSYPWFRLHLKNNKKKTFHMTIGELGKIKHELLDTNLRVVSGKDIYDRSQNYLD